MSLLIPVFVFCFLLVLQGALLQFSCAVLGADVPRYGRALGVALLAGLLAGFVGAAWGCTFGLLLRLLVGKTISTALHVGVAWLVTSVIHRSSLDMPFPQAALVAGLHNVLAWALAAGAWWLVW